MLLASADWALLKMILDVVLHELLDADLVVVVDVNEIGLQQTGLPFVVVDLYYFADDVIVLLPLRIAALVKGVLPAVEKPGSLFDIV